MAGLCAAVVVLAVLLSTPGSLWASRHADGPTGGHNGAIVPNACFAEGPYDSTAPTLTPTGSGPAGQTLTLNEGAWAVVAGACGTRVSLVSYDWYRDGTFITGTGGSFPGSSGGTTTYTTTSADAGHTITAHVTACDNTNQCTNVTANGSFSVNSQAPPPTCFAEGPYDSTAPTVSPTGSGPFGQALTLNEGTWVLVSGACGTRVSLVSYDWYRGSTWTGVGGSFSGSSGGTTTYTTQSADVGQVVTAQVTACDNQNECTNVTANGSFTPTCTSPSLVTAPSVSEARGVAGGALTTSNGSWNAPSCSTAPSYSYQWYRAGVAISGATARTYTPGSADLDQNVSAVVTACNGIGCRTANDSNSSTIYESALGSRRQYSYDGNYQPTDQESLQVNVADGNLVLTADDFSLPGIAGFGYHFTRSYNSRLSGLGSALTNPTLAPGWEDLPSLAFYANGDARYAGDSGYEVAFVKSGSSYSAPPGSEATLVQQGDGTFLLTFYKTGMKEKFSSAGQLLDEIDRNGNTIAFNWSSGQLATITDTTGRTITFAYTSGRVSSITAPGICSTSTCTYYYTYDVNGRLATYKDGTGQTTTYGYNAAGLLSSVKNPLGNEWAIVYDSQNRVTSITGGLNSSGACPTGGICPATTFTYTAAPTTLCANGMESDVTDPSGYVTSYCSDGRARVSKVKDPVGNVTTTDYIDTTHGGTNCTNAGGVTLDDQPCSATDGLNFTTMYGYDSSGQNRLWEQNPVQTSTQRSTWTYADPNHPYYATSFTDANGNRTTSVYDPISGNLTSTTSGLNSSGTCPSGTVCPRTDHIYFSNGALQADKLGLDWADACASGTACSRTDYTYDTKGELASETTGLALSDSCTSGTTCPKTTYVSDAAGNQTSRVDPLGNVAGGTPANYTSSSTYDNDGRVLTKKNELGKTTSYSYDGAGNQTTVKDANGYLTCNVYDANNRLMSGTDGLGSSSVCPSTLTCPTGSTCPKTSYIYYANGDLNKETDPNGNTTTDVYYANGNLKTQTDPLGNVTSYVYDADGKQTSMVEPRGYETQYTYDAIGELTTEQSGLTLQNGVYQCVSPSVCPKTTYGYDLAGNETSMLDPAASYTSYSYDAENRLSSVHSGLRWDAQLDGGNYTCFTYDVCPFTTYGYDGEGNTASVVDPNGYETKYTYDPMGNELSQTSGLNSSASCPSGDNCPTTSFTYDANANLATKIVPTAGGRAISYGYDHAGEQTSITYPSGYSTPNISYTYDADGNTKTMKDGVGTATYTYNNLDQLTNETRGTGTIFNYTYDKNGNVTGREYPDGTWSYYAYDAGDELCLVSTSSTAACGSTPSGVAYTTYTYTAAGDVKTTTPVNSSGATVETETRSYDSADFLKEIDTTTSTGTVADVAYTLNNGGMPTAITRSGTIATGGSNPVNCTVVDQYDNNERISSAALQSGCPPNGAAQTYTYSWDGDGNRLSVNNGSTTTSYAYNNLDELCAQSTGSASCTSPNYTYNANGDETKDSSSNTYNYDLENRLLSVSNSGGTASYSYDGEGNMLSKTASGATTSLLWDSNTDGTPQLALERNGTLGGGTVLHRYQYGNEAISETDSSHAFYYTHDGLGSVLDVVNASSAPQISYVFNTFGSTRAEHVITTPPANEIKFIGQRLDPATGTNGTSINLYDTSTRNLDTSTGRFLSQDPSATIGNTTGTYVYGNDNPDTYADPTGMASSAKLSPPPSGCHDATNTDYRKTLFNLYTKWQIWNHTHWCFRHRHITFISGKTTTRDRPGWAAILPTWHWAWVKSPRRPKHWWALTISRADEEFDSLIFTPEPEPIEVHQEAVATLEINAIGNFSRDGGQTWQVAGTASGGGSGGRGMLAE